MKTVSLKLIVALFALSIVFGCSKSNTPATTTENAAAGGAASGSAPAGGTGGAATTAAAPAPEPITIPAGRAIAIRFGETLVSGKSEEGQSFSGTVAEPVEVGGKTVIARGATVHGTVVSSKGMGHFKGGALLQVRLNSVTIHGAQHTIQTSVEGRSIAGKGKRSAGFIGGGAAAGALIGGLTGGGKGAAIGAAAGAGAGTAGAGLTGNKEVEFPAESAMTFKLKAPVVVR
ncbi:MAG TPA: hypothetical protein VFL42_14250 [Terriglobales bacterium]|nr:hypothetical protein [Terriglobales bacterium]